MTLSSYIVVHISKYLDNYSKEFSRYMYSAVST